MTSVDRAPTWCLGGDGFDFCLDWGPICSIYVSHDFIMFPSHRGGIISFYTGQMCTKITQD